MAHWSERILNFPLQQLKTLYLHSAHGDKTLQGGDLQQILELIPQSTRKCKTLNKFKTKIKSWCPDHCPCRLCKTYLSQLGFIWSAYIHLFMARIRLYTCDHSTFRAWCNYHALVSFAVVTIIFYMCLFDLYLNLHIYLCTSSYLLLLLLLSLLFLIFTLISHNDWYELELMLCIY